MDRKKFVLVYQFIFLVMGKNLPEWQYILSPPYMYLRHLNKTMTIMFQVNTEKYLIYWKNLRSQQIRDDGVI